MTTMTTNLTTDIVNTLRDGALTLTEIAGKLGVLVRDVRTPVAVLERDGALTTSLVKREGASSRTRVFALSERFLLQEQARLVVLAETGTEADLDALTVTELFIAADALLPTRLLRKTRKAEIISALIDAQCPMCSKCGDEPVDARGDVCTFCVEATQPKPKLATEPRQRKPRKPSVDISHLAPEVVAEAERIAQEAQSMWKAQRAIARLIADDENFVQAEVLRTLLRKFQVLSKPNFTLYMSKDGLTPTREGRKILGWFLPAE